MFIRDMGSANLNCHSNDWHQCVIGRIALPSHNSKTYKHPSSCSWYTCLCLLEIHPCLRDMISVCSQIYNDMLLKYNWQPYWAIIALLFITMQLIGWLNGRRGPNNVINYHLYVFLMTSRFAIGYLYGKLSNSSLAILFLMWSVIPFDLISLNYLMLPGHIATEQWAKTLWYTVATNVTHCIHPSYYQLVCYIMQLQIRGDNKYIYIIYEDYKKAIRYLGS